MRLILGGIFTAAVAIAFLLWGNIELLYRLVDESLIIHTDKKALAAIIGKEEKNLDLGAKKQAFEPSVPRGLSESEIYGKSTKVKSAANLMNLELLRASFKEDLRLFEETIWPQIRTKSFAEWNPEAQNKIVLLKGRSLEAFSESNYSKAVDNISAAIAMSKEELASRTEAFMQALEHTTTAIISDDYDQALQHIKKASKLIPEHKLLQPLYFKIKSLPTVLKHIKIAEVRRAENNFEGERAELIKAFELDSTRSELHNRIKTLDAKITDLAFYHAIRQGLSRIQKKDLQSAKIELIKAQNIDGKRQEARVLEKKIDELESQLNVAQLMREAETHGAQDEWYSAKNKYAEVLKIKPNHELAVLAHMRSLDILRLTKEINKHLTAHHRLAASNVFKIAKALVGQAGPLTSESLLLKVSVTELEKKLALYAQDVEVWVHSDGKTLVAVRGIGRIGKTSGRTINLKPGTYTFEGQRPGYQSKLVKVLVPAGEKLVAITVICDEPV